MRDNRLWTALVMIGICVFAVARGWGIIHFSLATADIDSLEKRAEIADTWSSSPGVGLTALQTDLTYQINPSDQKAADHRRDELSSMISLRPLASYYWLSLSGLQLITDQPMERVFGSLELSMLTGPNEGYLMEERGIYGVSLWQRLSPDLQRRVAADLAVGELPDDRLRTFVSAQPAEVRDELRTAVLATGLSPKELERRLGL